MMFSLAMLPAGKAGGNQFIKMGASGNPISHSGTLLVVVQCDPVLLQKLPFILLLANVVAPGQY